MSSDGSVYTPRQRLTMFSVYEKLARLLPTEGRDFNITMKFPHPDQPNRVSISMTPHTPIGKIWCDYCMKALKNTEEPK